MSQPTNTRFAVAVHLLTLLAQAAPGELLDSSALAISPAASPVHVRRVLGSLRAAGLVESWQGAHGGWALARPAQEIDLGQVWLAVNGEDPLLGVHSPDPNCPEGRRVQANLRSLDRRALEAMLAEIRSETVADMVAEGRSPIPAGAATRPG
jgi:Rrf2 family protein